jgi:hypothetical protein
VVHVEAAGLEAATARALEARGHKLQFGEEPGREQEPGLFNSVWGKACGVEVDAERGWMIASCDPRSHGGGAVP